MEYISKQSLLADLNEATPRSYFAFETMVREYPTEDVVPVVHAYWIMGGSQKYDEGRTNIMHCSNCKAYFRYIGRKQNINYCYRCGAVMEGIKDAKIHKHR